MAQIIAVAEVVALYVVGSLTIACWWQIVEIEVAIRKGNRK